MQVDLSKAWLTFSSIVLAFAFVFGNSIRNMYEAVIFLFVVHPFDVGDVLLMGADQTWCKVRIPKTAWRLLSRCGCVYKDSLESWPFHHPQCSLTPGSNGHAETLIRSPHRGQMQLI